MNQKAKVVRVAAVADIHYKHTRPQSFEPLFAEIAEHADVLLVCGDLTDYGLPEEAQMVAKDLAAARVPVVAVLGNHDYQSNQEGDIRKVLLDAGIHILDGESVELCGIGFAGTKGFAGGFGTRTLEPWGEPIIKAFVQESLNETLKLESALARLRVPQRIAVLHYSPIQGTVEGEALEIFPFLGSSRLEDPINRYHVAAVFHGHAHRGAPEGKTQAGIPVYNVSHTLLRASFPDRSPYRIVEIPVETTESA